MHHTPVCVKSVADNCTNCYNGKLGVIHTGKCMNMWPGVICRHMPLNTRAKTFLLTAGSGEFVGQPGYQRRTQCSAGRSTSMRDRTASRKASSAMCTSDWMMSES